MPGRLDARPRWYIKVHQPVKAKFGTFIGPFTHKGNARGYAIENGIDPEAVFLLQVIDPDDVDRALEDLDQGEAS